MSVGSKKPSGKKPSSKKGGSEEEWMRQMKQEQVAKQAPPAPAAQPDPSQMTAEERRQYKREQRARILAEMTPEERERYEIEHRARREAHKAQKANAEEQPPPAAAAAADAHSNGQAAPATAGGGMTEAEMEEARRLKEERRAERRRLKEEELARRKAEEEAARAEEERRRREEEERKAEEEKTRQQQQQGGGEENEGDGYDDEDFEEYDEDFEDDEGEEPPKSASSATAADPKVLAMQQAMERENAYFSQPARGSSDYVSPSNRSLGSSGSFNKPGSASKPPPSASGMQLPERKMVSLSESQKTVSAIRFKQSSAGNRREALAKWKEVLKHTTMEYTGGVLFDSRAMVKSFQFARDHVSSVSKNSVRCGFDENDRSDIQFQTDDIRNDDVACQCPEDLRMSTSQPTTTTSASPVAEADANRLSFDPFRLSAFLDRASKVMGIVLEENLGKTKASASHLLTRADSTFSSAYINLSCASLMSGRPITGGGMCCSSSANVVLAHGLGGQAIGPISAQSSFLTVWSIHKPTSPTCVLVLRAHPTSCCLCKKSVFAGTDEGEVLVWDLRDVPPKDMLIPIDGVPVPFLDETFSTNGLFHFAPVVDDEIKSSSRHLTAALVQADRHGGPVSKVCVIGQQASNSGAPLSDGSVSDTGLQLASVDVTGLVFVWLVVFLSDGEPAGSDTDLGLYPNGRVKLIRSSAIELAPLNRLGLPFEDVSFMPGASQLFMVATDTGEVHKLSCFGQPPAPRKYTASADVVSAFEVTAIDFSPWFPEYFVCAYGDGSVSLHHLSRSLSLQRFYTAGLRLEKVMWSRSRPALFFALDCLSNVYIFDLLSPSPTCVHTERFGRGGKGSSHIVAMDLSDNRGQPACLLAFSGGEVDIHLLSSKFAVLVPDEVTLAQKVLQAL